MIEDQEIRRTKSQFLFVCQINSWLNVGSESVQPQISNALIGLSRGETNAFSLGFPPTADVDVDVENVKSPVPLGDPLGFGLSFRTGFETTLHSLVPFPLPLPLPLPALSMLSMSSGGGLVVIIRGVPTIGGESVISS
jgi:hypothetical protein